MEEAVGSNSDALNIPLDVLKQESAMAYRNVEIAQMKLDAAKNKEFYYTIKNAGHLKTGYWIVMHKRALSMCTLIEEEARRYARDIAQDSSCLVLRVDFERVEENA